MGLYHDNAMTGDELKAAIGNPVSVTGFDMNPHATGASVNDFYGLNAGTPEVTGPVNKGPGLAM